MVGRSAFDIVNASYGDGLRDVGRESVNGFRRECDDPAAPQNLNGTFDHAGVDQRVLPSGSTEAKPVNGTSAAGMSMPPSAR